MRDHIYDMEDDGDPILSAGQILSLARVGVAASDSAMSVDLQRNGYQNLFEVIGDIAGKLMDEISALESKTEVPSKANQASQERG